VPWPLPLIGILAYLSWINIALLAFNLVPAFPLDGGRVLRSLLWAWKRDLRWATRIASAIGSGFAFLMIGWGIFRFLIGDFVGGIWSFLIGLFIRNASQMSYRQILLRETLSGEPVGRLMTPNPVTIQPADSVKTIVEDYLYKYPYKSYPVVQDGNLLGCVTIDQVKQIPRAEWSQRTAESVAAPCSSENMIEPQADAGKALSRMSNAHVSRLMVVDHGRLVGIIALRDLANYFSRKLEFEGA
jgi:CBS domain-containing protein